MSIHSRGAAEEVLELLRAHDAGVPVLHWFTGGQNELEDAINAGCWFSVGPAMLKSKAGRERAATMPRGRLLPETDGPFGQVRRKPLEPTDADSVVAVLSEIWATPADEVRQQLMQNLRSLISYA